jgi:hypothetical protein
VDDIVKRAMLKWPDVPDVYGWLRLDRRGDWQVRTASGQFDRMRNPSIVEFINRNYLSDERGRWFFQNGPQRVFVSLDYAPYVYRLDDRHTGWLAHTGVSAASPTDLLFDEDDSMLLVTALGPGLMLDRDLGFMLEHLRDPAGVALDAEEILGRLSETDVLPVQCLGYALRAARVKKSDLEKRYGYVARPETEPDAQDACNAVVP